MYFANTHMHSIFSDGVWTPEKLVELGKEIGHKAMLLTDHDTISGYHRFQKACRKEGILTLVSTEFGALCSFGRMHIVAVDFNPENKGIRELLARQSARMTEFTHFLFDESLAKGTLRAGLTWQDVLDAYSDFDYLCNNRVFDLMVERGIYKPEEYTEFRPNFKPDKPRQWEIEKIIGIQHATDEEVIDTVLKAGGVPIVAHPSVEGKYFFEEEAERYIKMGIKGFEVNHPIMSEEEKAFYNRVCEEHGLYKMGGIDHSGLIGGFADVLPENEAHPSEGYIDEENFMKLYNRELG